MLNIHLPLFSATELGKVAGIERKLVNLWLERELIQPTRIERLAVRKRPLFSVVAIFKARLIRILSGSLLVSASGSMLAGAEAERASKPGAATRSRTPALPEVIADEGWMWAVARSVESGKALPLVAAITRSDDCWDFFLGLEVSSFARRFAPEVPYAVVPIGEIFASVYLECKALIPDSTSERPRKKRRAGT
jgi:hypothetical protein